MERKIFAVPPNVLQRSAISIVNVIKQGWLFQSSGSGLKKTWKKRWFILDSEYFYCFNDDGAKQPLKVHVLQNYDTCDSVQIGDSASQQKYSFRISTQRNPQVKPQNLCGATSTERDEWIYCFKKAMLSVHDPNARYGEGKHRVEISVYIKVSDARFKDDVLRDSYCVVSVDGVQKARTATAFGSSKPLYSQEYEFIDLERPENLVVAIKETKKKLEGIFVGQAIIPLNNLSGDEVQKYPLYPAASERGCSGTLRLMFSIKDSKMKVFVLSATGLTAVDNTGTSDPFVVISYGEKKWKSAICKKQLNPVWKNQVAQFTFDSQLPLVAEVMDGDNKQGSEFLGQCTIQALDIINSNGREIDHVLKNRVDQNQEPVGVINLSVQKRISSILPDKSYDQIFQFLVDNPSMILKLACVSSSKEKPVAEALVKSFDVKNSAVHYIKNITKYEIANTTRDNVLFRANTVCTKSMDMFLQLHGSAYLSYLLKLEVEKILAGGIKKKSCELDPSRITESPSVTIKKNLKTLTQYLDAIMHSIATSLNRCPATFRSVFKFLQETVVEKFRESPVVRYTSATGFIFLRFVCPALLTPKTFGLLEEDPPPNTQRDLMLIAKTLQNLANMVQFGNKEEFMTPANEWIQKNMDTMKTYIDALCTMPTGAVDELCSKRNTNWGREMSCLTFHLAESRQRLKDHFGSGHTDIEQLDIELDRLAGIEARLTIDGLSPTLLLSSQSVPFIPRIEYTSSDGAPPAAAGASPPASPSSQLKTSGTNPIKHFNSTGSLQSGQSSSPPAGSQSARSWSHSPGTESGGGNTKKEGSPVLTTNQSLPELKPVLGRSPSAEEKEAPTDPRSPIISSNPLRRSASSKFKTDLKIRTGCDDGSPSHLRQSSGSNDSQNSPPGSTQRSGEWKKKSNPSPTQSNNPKLAAGAARAELQLPSLSLSLQDFDALTDRLNNLPLSPARSASERINKGAEPPKAAKQARPTAPHFATPTKYQTAPLPTTAIASEGRKTGSFTKQTEQDFLPTSHSGGNSPKGPQPLLSHNVVLPPSINNHHVAALRDSGAMPPSPDSPPYLRDSRGEAFSLHPSLGGSVSVLAPPATTAQDNNRRSGSRPDLFPIPNRREHGSVPPPIKTTSVPSVSPPPTPVAQPSPQNARLKALLLPVLSTQQQSCHQCQEPIVPPSSLYIRFGTLSFHQNHFRCIVCFEGLSPSVPIFSHSSGTDRETHPCCQKCHYLRG